MTCLATDRDAVDAVPATNNDFVVVVEVGLFTLARNLESNTNVPSLKTMARKLKKQRAEPANL